MRAPRPATSWLPLGTIDASAGGTGSDYCNRCGKQACRPARRVLPEVVQGEHGSKRSTCGRCFTNAGVVCLTLAGVAASLTRLWRRQRRDLAGRLAAFDAER
jgi:hypothetical protein